MIAEGAGAAIGAFIVAGLLAPGGGGGGLTAETCEAAATRARVPIRRVLIMVFWGWGSRKPRALSTSMIKAFFRAVLSPVELLLD